MPMSKSLGSEAPGMNAIIAFAVARSPKIRVTGLF